MMVYDLADRAALKNIPELMKWDKPGCIHRDGHNKLYLIGIKWSDGPDLVTEEEQMKLVLDYNEAEG